MRAWASHDGEISRARRAGARHRQPTSVARPRRRTGRRRPRTRPARAPAPAPGGVVGEGEPHRRPVGSAAASIVASQTTQPSEESRRATKVESSPVTSVKRCVTAVPEHEHRGGRGRSRGGARSRRAARASLTPDAAALRSQAAGIGRSRSRNALAHETRGARMTMLPSAPATTATAITTRRRPAQRAERAGQVDRDQARGRCRCGTGSRRGAHSSRRSGADPYSDWTWS